MSAKMEVRHIMNFTRLGQYLDTLKDVHIPAWDIAVYKDHEPIYRHMAGYRDREQTLPLQGDETYCLYSATKVVTTCAVMQLVGQEKLHLDDPVSWYLPAFSSLKVKKGDAVVPAERVMTIRHLLSRQSGLDYETDTPEIRKVMSDTDKHATTRQIVDSLPQRPLCFEPGTDFLYSMSHDVLGALIEVVSGQSFSEYLKDHIFTPLGMTTIGFSLKEADQKRLCAQYVFNEETGGIDDLPDHVTTYRISDRYESGGAGLMSNVQDYITFADALACGGRAPDGTQILSPEMMELWRANQLGPKARRSFDEWQRLGYSYGLGVRTRVDLTKGGPGTIGEFGWDGAAGAFALIDPYRHVSAFFAMHVKSYGYVYDVVHPKIRTLIYEGLEQE